MTAGSRDAAPEKAQSARNAAPVQGAGETGAVVKTSGGRCPQFSGMGSMRSRLTNPGSRISDMFYVLKLWRACMSRRASWSGVWKVPQSGGFKFGPRMWGRRSEPSKDILWLGSIRICRNSAPVSVPTFSYITPPILIFGPPSRHMDCCQAAPTEAEIMCTLVRPRIRVPVCGTGQ